MNKMDFDEYEDIRLPNGLNITENKLYEAMKKIGLNPIPQYPISEMRVDFAFPEEMIAIEVDGDYHNTEEQKIRDRKRWFVLNSRGWKRRTFTAKQVYYYPMDVARKIKRLLGKEDEKQEILLTSYIPTKEEYKKPSYSPAYIPERTEEEYKQFYGLYESQKVEQETIEIKPYIGEGDFIVILTILTIIFSYTIIIGQGRLIAFLILMVVIIIKVIIDIKKSRKEDEHKHS